MLEYMFRQFLKCLHHQKMQYFLYSLFCLNISFLPYFYLFKSVIGSVGIVPLCKLLPTLITCSTSLLAYPHSLSYQAKTLTILPATTCVNGKSTIADSLLPMISLETKNPSEIASIPL